MAVGSRAKNRTSKAEQSRATRRRIVEAATGLFVRDGFLGTTMAAIAAEAGVAVQTLYLSFGSKTAILAAAFDTAIVGDNEPVGILERDWFHAVVNDPDGRAAATRFISHASSIMRRVAPLYAVIQSSAADPDVAGLLARNRQERHDGFAVIAAALATRDGFSPDLSPDDATGILYAIQSEDSYLLLVEQHGWTAERWEQWIRDTILGQFFPDVSPRKRSSGRAPVKG